MPTHLTPVVDYEPEPTRIEACLVPSPATMRRLDTRRRRLSGRSCEPELPAVAHAFADAALRSVLEVLDRRRPVVQLRPLMPLTMMDTVVAISGSSHRAAAVLRRVRLRPAGTDRNQPAAAEVFATYSRGNRVGAIAARIELMSTTSGPRWQLVALHLG